MTQFSFTLILILFLSTVSISYGQSKEDTLGVYTDVKSYFKVTQLREVIVSKDSIISLQAIQVNACDKFADSLKFELNTAIILGRNLQTNCKSEISKIKRGQTFIKVALYVLVPVVIAESVFIYLK